MKYILKGTEPAEFIDWKNQANEDWTPSYEILQAPEKEILHTALMAEQGYLCCYCGKRIDERTESHIEHLIPQCIAKDLELEYSNLLASCNGSSEHIVVIKKIIGMMNRTLLLR